MVKVTCAEEREVSVYSRCAFCIHCEGAVVGRREMPNPVKKALADSKLGAAGDEDVQQAQMMLNIFFRDGSALLCSDDANKGFKSLYIL